MSVTVPTVYIYDIKTITRKTRRIPNTKDRWTRDSNINDVNNFSRYIKLELKL